MGRRSLSNAGALEKLMARLSTELATLHAIKSMMMSKKKTNARVVEARVTALKKFIHTLRSEQQAAIKAYYRAIGEEPNSD